MHHHTNGNQWAGKPQPSPHGKGVLPHAAGPASLVRRHTMFTKTDHPNGNQWACGKATAEPTWQRGGLVSPHGC